MRGPHRYRRSKAENERLRARWDAGRKPMLICSLAQYEEVKRRNPDRFVVVLGEPTYERLRPQTETEHVECVLSIQIVDCFAFLPKRAIEAFRLHGLRLLRDLVGDAAKPWRAWLGPSTVRQVEAFLRTYVKVECAGNANQETK